MGRVFSTSISGSLKHLERLLKSTWYGEVYDRADQLAQKGLMALMDATPKDTYLTANSWTYDIKIDADKNIRISWSNSNTTPDGTPIVILLQYGHGTATGGYVQGQDFINGALKETFSEIKEAMWEVVTDK